MFQLVGNFLRFSRPLLTIRHPKPLEYIAIPFTNIAEIKCVENFVVIHRKDNCRYSFQYNSYEEAQKAFEGLTMQSGGSNNGNGGGKNDGPRPDAWAIAELM